MAGTLDQLTGLRGFAALVGVLDLRADPAPVRDSDVLLRRPFTDRPVLLFTGVAGRGQLGAPIGHRALLWHPADPSEFRTGLRVCREDLTHLVGILLGQIDLVLDAINDETDGLVSLFAADVVDEHVNRALSQGRASFREVLSLSVVTVNHFIGKTHKDLSSNTWTRDNSVYEFAFTDARLVIGG